MTLSLLVKLMLGRRLGLPSFSSWALLAYATLASSSLLSSYSSKNYVRKFLRALHPKWRAKVTAIEDNLKAKKESSDKECSTSGSEDEEYAMSVRNFKKFFKRRECPKPPKDKNQRAFVRGSWSDSREEDDENV
ncbi:hypothetical protein Tco_0435592 [Tanacetum coccineum]